MVIIYNGEHDSSIWGTGKVAIFKLGVKKSKHQYCLRSDGKCRLLTWKPGPLLLWEARLKCCFFRKEGWGLLSDCSMAFPTWILGKVNKINYKWFWGLFEIFDYWLILADAIGWTFNFLDVVTVYCISRALKYLGIRCYDNHLIFKTFEEKIRVHMCVSAYVERYMEQIEQTYKLVT